MVKHRLYLLEVRLDWILQVQGIYRVLLEDCHLGGRGREGLQGGLEGPGVGADPGHWQGGGGGQH